MTSRRIQSDTYPDLLDFTEHFLTTADTDDWDATSRDLIEDLRDEVIELRLAKEATTDTITAAVDAAVVDTLALDAISGIQHAYTVIVTRTQVRPTLIVAADERTAIEGAVAWHANDNTDGWDDHDGDYGSAGSWIEETFGPGEDPSLITSLNAADILAATQEPS